MSNTTITVNLFNSDTDFFSENIAREIRQIVAHLRRKHGPSRFNGKDIKYFIVAQIGYSNYVKAGYKDFLFNSCTSPANCCYICSLNDHVFDFHSPSKTTTKISVDNIETTITRGFCSTKCAESQVTRTIAN